MPNPFSIDVGNPLQGLGAMANAYGRKVEKDELEEKQLLQQEQAQASRLAMQEEIGGLIERGDIMEMSKYMAANPQLSKGIENAYNFKSDATKANKSETALKILSGADPYQAIRERAEMVKAQGGDPSHGLADLERSPEELKQMSAVWLANSGTPEQKKAAVDFGMIGGKGSGMTEYQRQSLALKKEESDIKRLERQLDRDAKNEKLALDIAEKKRRIDKDKADMVKRDLVGYEKTTDLLTTIGTLEGHPGLESAVGVSSFFPTVPGTDAAAFESYLDQYQSQQFMDGVAQMKGMGALSESEGKKISAAASALNLNMSDEEFKKELNIIKSGLQKAKERQLEKLPQGVRDRVRAEEYATKVEGMPRENQKGWGLMVDSNGRAAYVGPSGEIEEVE